MAGATEYYRVKWYFMFIPMGKRSVLLQMKVPKSMVASLDKLVEACFSRSRSEAVAE